MMATEWPLLALFGLALLLLGGVTVGVGYLTWAEWRDRRRRQQMGKRLRR
ncbi:MAG: hypothetical protein NZL92_03095 [Gloeomargarita sp. SKYG116]|nr:hypothetical protein [Gloeomargarita sp. SKYG116]MCS7227003.1 hypothetical protein [Gloeomargarita sp. SKYB31]MDW8400667.1 hypothetical protein [Gloeomargarita sp. SKYGB_i_bin116]